MLEAAPFSHAESFAGKCLERQTHGFDSGMGAIFQKAPKTASPDAEKMSPKMGVSMAMGPKIDCLQRKIRNKSSDDWGSHR